MGYRSQVIVAIKSKLYESHKDKVNRLTSDCDNKLVKNGVVYFTWDSVKWYDIYPEVAEIQEFIANNEKSSALARVGEDINDIEFLNDPYEFFITLNRELTIDT
jgi:hypothetical protein